MRDGMSNTDSQKRWKIGHDWWQRWDEQHRHPEETKDWSWLMRDGGGGGGGGGGEQHRHPEEMKDWLIHWHYTVSTHRFSASSLKYPVNLSEKKDNSDRKLNSEQWWKIDWFTETASAHRFSVSRLEHQVNLSEKKDNSDRKLKWECTMNKIKWEWGGTSTQK